MLAVVEFILLAKKKKKEMICTYSSPSIYFAKSLKSQ